MPVVTYHAFWCSLGSLLVATLGAPLWIAPRFFSFGRHLVGWLMAAVTVRALADAPGLVLSTEETAMVRNLEMIGVLLSMTLFAEAARSSAHVIGRRPTSAWWHVPVGLASGAHVVFAISPALAEPLGRLAALTWLGPVALTVFATAGLWQALVRHVGIQIPQRRTVLKIAVVGFALSNFFALAAMPGERDLPATAAIWLAVTGLSVLALTVPEFRRQVALVMVTSIVLVPFLGPFVAALNVRLADQRFESRAREIAEAGRAIAGFDFVVGDGIWPEDPAAEQVLAAHLRSVRQRDHAMRDAYFWTLRDDHLWRYQAAGNSVSLVKYRRADPTEIQPASGSSTFFVRIPAAEEGGIVAAHARVPAPDGGKAPVWLAVEYPDALWLMQLDSARRNGASMVALFAVLMAVGVVLGSVQSVENARHTRLQRAEGANRAKREFLAFLSHELRTPLQSVLGRAELLQRSSLPAAERRQAGAILEDGRMLLRLVTDLLDLGSIEAGRLQLQPAPCVLREALQSLVDSYRGRAESRGLALNLEIAPNVPEVVLADEARVRQMLGNFLSNGLKYTEQGSVTMLVRCLDPLEEGKSRKVEFVVRDTGPGVPPAQIDRLFSLFTRVDAGNVRRREGTGVGLALVRRLCKLMGGEVHAANRPEGGAEFTLRLNFPLAARADLRRGEIEGTTTPVAQGRRALVVEDNPSAREWLSEAMAALGFSVRAVAEGEAALAALAEGHIDVVMMDINLPGRDGMAVAREMRLRQPALHIVGCSAEAFAATRDAALAAGMNDYLTKPVSLAELEKAVSQPGAAPRDLFARLHSHDTTRRARVQLRADWPGLRLQTERTLAAGDAGALRRLGHYLKSTALLTQDEKLASLCERSNGNGATSDPLAGPEFLAAVENHIASWPAETETKAETGS